MNNIITTDKILAGKITVKQLKNAYRVGIDAILLASIVDSSPELPEVKILDLGAGVGSVSLCILNRIANARIISIEKVPKYFKLCEDNIRLNSFVKERYTPLLGEINNFKHLYNTFDIVVTNPPYYKKSESRESDCELKTLANVESSATLIDFINAAYNYLKPKGTLYMIQKTFRIIEALQHGNKWGNINVYPIYSYSDSLCAERSIISMQKHSKKPFKINNPIIVHNKDASYTKEVEIAINGGAYINNINSKGD